jgi:hypothetical protein
MSRRSALSRLKQELVQVRACAHAAVVQSATDEWTQRTDSARGPPLRKFEHLGAWEYNQIERTHAWSCCMSTERDSRGCTVTPMKVGGWNFVSS